MNSKKINYNFNIFRKQNKKTFTPRIYNSKYRIITFNTHFKNFTNSIK